MTLQEYAKLPQNTTPHDEQVLLNWYLQMINLPFDRNKAAGDANSN